MARIYWLLITTKRARMMECQLHVMKSLCNMRFWMRFHQKYLSEVVRTAAANDEHKPIKFNDWKQIEEKCTHFSMLIGDVRGGSIFNVLFQLHFSPLLYSKKLEWTRNTELNRRNVSKWTNFYAFPQMCSYVNACVAEIETKPIFALNFKWFNSLNTFYFYMRKLLCKINKFVWNVSSNYTIEAFLINFIW